ncbi:MAG: rod shape-determining protein MreC [Planctomycetota bacterium]
MKRGGLFVIHAVIAALFALGLTANAESLREQLRLGLARFFSRPWGSIQTLARGDEASPLSEAWLMVIQNHPETSELPRMRAELAAERHFSGESVPLLEVLPERRTILLGAGWRDGIRPGQVVYGRGVFLGFVDRVEEHLARVRTPGHPRSRYGARILSEDGERQLQTVLLSGEGSRIAKASAGRPLETSSQGGLAWRDLKGSSLFVGRVKKDQESGEIGIELAAQTQPIDRVGLASTTDDAPFRVNPQAVFSSFSTRILSAGDSSFAERSWLIDGGNSQGLGSGDLVVRDGIVVGVVSWAGRGTSRVRPLDPTTLASLIRGPDGRWQIFETGGDQRGEPRRHLRFSRTRRLRGPVFGPEGLLLAKDPMGVFAACGLGTRLEVFRFLHRTERQRLLGKGRGGG